MSDADDAARKYRRQDAIHWQRTGTDSFGRPTFDAPADVKVRWEDVHEEFMDASGERQVSNAKVLVGEEMTPGDYLMLGKIVDLDDPTNPQDKYGAYEIRRFETVPNAKATKFLRTAML